MPMQKIAVRIPKFYRNSLFSVLLVSWCTGIAFFIFSRWITIDGDFGQEKHPWQNPILQIHGAAAFVMMIAFGSIIGAHVPASWKLNRMRGIGATLVTVLGLQIVTAYFLYYLSNEQARVWIANMHATLGAVLPLPLIIHIFVGVKTRRRRLAESS